MSSRPLLQPITESEIVGEGYLTPHEGISYQCVLTWARFYRQIMAWNIVPVSEQTTWDADTFGYEHLGGALYLISNSLRWNVWTFLIYCPPTFATYYDAMLYLREHLTLKSRWVVNGGLSQWYEWREQ